MADAPSPDAQGYVTLVAELKQHVADARLRPALSVIRELALFHWGLAERSFPVKKVRAGAPRSSTDYLPDLGRAFPEITRLPAQNLKYMRASAEAWPDVEFVQQVVALLP